MNQAGRRIAFFTASLLFTASLTGLLLSAVFAEEGEHGENPPASQLSQTVGEDTESTPATAGESGPVTDPAAGPTQEESGVTTTAEDGQTDPAVTTDDIPDTTATAPGSSEEPTTQTTVVTVVTTEPPVTTTQTEASTSTRATQAPSHDPILSAGAAVSEPMIPLSTEEGGRPADSDHSASGENPGGASGGTYRGTDSAGRPLDIFSEDESGDDAQSSGKGIRQITVLCSVFALLSGAVLVLLKFIR